MASITVAHVSQQNEWEACVQRYPHANFLQSWWWGEFHKRLNHPIIRLGIYEKGKLTGVCLGIIEHAKRGTYMTVPAGPLIDWGREEIVSACIDALKDAARGSGCIAVRIRPQEHDSPDMRARFSQLKAVPAPMHVHAQHTRELDITPSEETLLSAMRKATRYEIKKANTLGITIIRSTDPDEIDGFYALQLATARRHGFVPFSLPYLKEQFRVFTAAGMATLYSAYKDGVLLAQAYVIFYGLEAAYHYGAGTDEGRKYPGAYLIQWEAIREAKKRGMQRYNLWGVAPEDDASHRFAGLSIFKRGFGGQDVIYLPAQDIIIDPVRYAFFAGFELIRKHLRRV